MKEVRDSNLDLELGVARELHQEELDAVLNDEEPAPHDVLRAIREITYLIASEGPESDLLNTLSRLVGQIEGPVTRVDLLLAQHQEVPEGE